MSYLPVDPLQDHERWLKTNGKEGKRFLACDNPSVIAGFYRQHPTSNVNLSRANLSGINVYRAWLSCFNFSGAIMTNVRLPGAKLLCAKLRGAELQNANLSSALLYDADLSDADLSGANLDHANLCLTRYPDVRAEMPGSKSAILRSAKLERAQLSYAKARNADLTSANLQEAILSGADLMAANLSNASLLYASLKGANLSKSDLTKADLRAADLSGASLHDAKWHGTLMWDTNLTDADLRGVRLPPAPVIENLDIKILTLIESRKGTLSQDESWTHTSSFLKYHHAYRYKRFKHEHSLARWAITLAGEEGAKLEERFGAGVAGSFIYYASTGSVPDFFKRNVMHLLRSRAKKEDDTRPKRSVRESRSVSVQPISPPHFEESLC